MGDNGSKVKGNVKVNGESQPRDLGCYEEAAATKTG
jgi:hypothetical protein